MNNLTERMSVVARGFGFAAMLLLAISGGTAKAQGPQGREFGFGLILGEPTGLTIKYWVSPTNALVADVGSSYFGVPRLQIDYLWHVNAFRSSVVTMYAGPGLAVGFGTGSTILYKQNHDYFYYRTNEAGFGARMIFGLNIIPRQAPFEIFGEVGPMIGISPGFGVAIDAAVGVRFYP